MADISQAKYWRDRAEEARAMANQVKDPDAKQAYLEIAKSCDILVARLERRDKDNSALKA